MTEDRRFFGRAWGSLRSTHNAFGKLCLLALLQLVPVVGQMVLLGYVLGWVRQAAWRRESPLPAHVCGRGDADFWPRGALAWCVEVLYGLAIAVVDAVVVSVPACMAGMGAPHLAVSVAVGVATAVVIVLDGLMLLSMYVGLARMAIYNSFACAWQMGTNLKMAFHDFGGLLKVALAGLGLQVLMGVGALLAVLAFGLPLGLSPALLGHVSSLAAAPFGQALAAGMAALPALLLAVFLMEIPFLLVEALTWRAFGNWVAQFDVACWGTRHDPLPYERERAGQPTGASEPAQTPASATTEPRDAAEGQPAGADGCAEGEPAGTEAAAAPSPDPAAASGVAGAAAAAPASAGPAAAGDDGTSPAASAQAAPSAETTSAAGTERREAAPAPTAPERRCHPVLICVLTLVGAALAMALAGCAACAGAVEAGQFARGMGSMLAPDADDGALEGSWRTSDGQTVTLGADRTFTWTYADGSVVKGTYVTGEVTDRFDANAADALSALGELGLDVSARDFAGARTYEVVLTAHSGADASGAAVSGRVPGNSLDVLFAVRDSSAQLYDLASGQEVSAWRQ